MKKSKIKQAVRQAVQKHYGDAGFTATADRMMKSLFSSIDKLYNSKIKKHGKEEERENKKV